jgi:hypothetical protein
MKELKYAMKFYAKHRGEFWVENVMEKSGFVILEVFEAILPNPRTLGK